jgi:hypothetical protein
MKRRSLIIIPAILVVAISVQSESTANAGSYLAGKREPAVTLSNTQRAPVSSRPTSYRPSAYGSAIGQTRQTPTSYRPPTYRSAIGQTQPATTNLLGSAHGRRLTPAQSQALINSPGFRRCGVDVSCTTRIVSDRPGPDSPSSLGDMLAREQIRDAMAIGLSPFAQTPARIRTRTLPADESVGDALARQAVRQYIGEFMMGF